METVLLLKIEEEKTSPKFIKDFLTVAETVQKTIKKDEKKTIKNLWRKI